MATLTQPPTESFSEILELIKLKKVSDTFHLATLKSKDNSVITAVCNSGVLKKAIEGHWYVISGEFEDSSKYGKQLKVTGAQAHVPNTEEAIVNYLGQGVLVSLGRKDAEKIYKHFKDKSVEIVNNHPERLLEVQGLDPVRVQEAIEYLKKVRGPEMLRQELACLELKPFQFKALQQTFDFNTLEGAVSLIDDIKRDPYLLQKASGITLQMLDPLAKKYWGPTTALSRAKASIREALNSCGQQGDLGLSVLELQSRCTKYYSCDLGSLQQAYSEMTKSGELRVVQHGEGPRNAYAFLEHVYLQEQKVALALKSKLYYGSTPFQSLSRKGLERLLGDGKIKNHHGVEITLSEKQKDAIFVALTNPVAVITGGPGTGKTTIIRAIVDISAKAGYKVLGVGPSGKACVRASESLQGTGITFSTMHHALDFRPDEKPSVNSDAPLDAHLVMGDEYSMVDSESNSYLVDAIEVHACVLFVGDIEQLSSVGPGAVLRDLIESEVVPVARLTKMERVVEGSDVLKVLSDIADGKVPRIEGSENVFLVDVDSLGSSLGRSPDERALNKLKAAINYMLTKKGFKPADIQIYVPGHEGMMGAKYLNVVGQDLLNPHGSPCGLKTNLGTKDEPLLYEYRIGDRVMHVKRNKYDENKKIKVSNGHEGKVVAYDKTEGVLSVKYPDSENLESYAADDMYYLTPSWATTIHKSQGSEAKCVITSFLASHPKALLQKNMVWTGYSRTRDTLVSIHSIRALKEAIERQDSKKRVTLLRHFLVSEELQPSPIPIDPCSGMFKLNTAGKIRSLAAPSSTKEP